MELALSVSAPSTRSSISRTDRMVVVNFIQKDLPPGSRTGAGFLRKTTPSGALGMGQRASTGLTMCTSTHLGIFYTTNFVQSTPSGPTLPHSEERGLLMSTSVAISLFSMPISLPSLVTSSSSCLPFLQSSSSPKLPSPSSRSVSLSWVSELVASSRTFRL
jgi:hypothetical protein